MYVLSILDHDPECTVTNNLVCTVCTACYTKFTPASSTVLTKPTATCLQVIVVDYFATWCGPCVRIAPTFSQLAAKFKESVFLKVDVDKCKVIPCL